MNDVLLVMSCIPNFRRKPGIHADSISDHISLPNARAFSKQIGTMVKKGLAMSMRKQDEKDRIPAWIFNLRFQIMPS